MTKYILIIWLTNFNIQGGNAVTTAEFANAELCHAAGQDWASNNTLKKGQERRRWYNYQCSPAE